MDRRLLTLALGMFAIGTDSFVVAGILPSVAHSLGTSVSLAGQMVTVYALSFGLLGPIMAAVAGAWPRKTLLLTGLCIFVIGNALTAMAPNLDMVLMSRVLAGLGAAMFSPTALGAAALLVAPERRGRALSTVTAGLAGATALGAPLGTFIGGLTDWRGTLWFVAILGVVALIGVSVLLKAIPTPPRISLGQRIAPVHDLRVALTLLTSLLTFGGLLMVYTYIGLTFDRVTEGNPNILAGLLFFWGVAATIGNLFSGRLVDRFGGRRTINSAITIAALNFALLPWSSAHMVTALVALAVWGVCGWGLLVPQQHRLVTIVPQVAPLALALNNAATYIGVASGGVIGGIVILFLDVHYLGLAGAASIALALVAAEAAHRQIVRRAITDNRLAAAE